LLQNGKKSSSKQMRTEAVEKINDSIIMNTCPKCGNKLKQFIQNKIENDHC
jgi:predicted nucleic acid-binding Zn ribbon protein